MGTDKDLISDYRIGLRQRDDEIAALRARVAERQKVVRKTEFARQILIEELNRLAVTLDTQGIMIIDNAIAKSEAALAAKNQTPETAGQQPQNEAGRKV